MRTARRWLVMIALAAGAAPTYAAQARVDPSISIAHCLDVITREVPRDDARCPGFLIQPLADAQQACADVGGKLIAAPTSDVWSLDVNHDGIPEYAFELANNAGCDAAASLFDCGSLGCPKTIYQRTPDADGGTAGARHPEGQGGARHPDEDEGAWHPIAQIAAATPDLVEVLPAAPGQSYGALRVRCLAPCEEVTTFEWTNAYYGRSYLDVRGHRVETEDSEHGLRSMVATVDVLAEPKTGAASVGRYDAGTEVAIVGTAGDWYYVSPCNACESGFVLKSSVRALNQ